MKLLSMISLAVVLALCLGGLYFTMPGQAPSGQPALIEMNNQALAELQAVFNREASSERIVLLLSPT